MIDPNTTARIPVTPRPATAAELTEILGELEPIALEQLLATGASIDEVNAAAAALAADDSYGDSRHEPSSPRELEVRGILEALSLDEDDDAEAAYDETARA